MNYIATNTLHRKAYAEILMNYIQADKNYAFFYAFFVMCWKFLA